MRRQRIDWSVVPECHVERPSCPLCGSFRYDRVRTTDQGDGSILRQVVCRGCLGPFKLILEVPETGNTGGVDW